MLRTPVLLLAILCAQAAAAPSVARPEIEALLSRLVASGCSFQRNGNWHGGADARKHLVRKLEYLEDRGMVRTTEQFIELAASSSSTSGKPYLVKCGNAAPVESRAWLSGELKALRAAPAR